MTPPDRPVSARLEELRRLREAGTPGTWPTTDENWELLDFLTHGDYIGTHWFKNYADAELIGKTINALPALLDIAEAAAVCVEWAYGDGRSQLDEEWAAGIDRLRAALDRLNTEDGAGR